MMTMIIMNMNIVKVDLFGEHNLRQLLLRLLDLVALLLKSIKRIIC